MKTSSEDYRLLDQDSINDRVLYNSSPRWCWPRYFKALFVAFLVSISINFLVGVRYLLREESHVPVEKLQEVTRFAGLTWNYPKTFEHGGLYDSPNKTMTDEAWASLNYDSGAIALTDEDAELMGLPRAQRFPWDDSKGVYFISGYHSIHCLTILRAVMHELRDGKPLSFTFEHSIHCLDTLLQDVLCFADDTPRYTTELHPGSSGFNQPRQCRSWSQLEAWAQQHTACWRDILPSDAEINTLIRYKFCPPASPYYEQIHEVFGDFVDDEAGPLKD